MGEVDYIFLSTDPNGLKLLKNIDITLVYPNNEIRNEYLDRYIQRDSPYEFIGVFMKYWDKWINELKELKGYNNIVLRKGEYLSDILTITK